jgi:hypothetical protein
MALMTQSLPLALLADEAKGGKKKSALETS